MLRVFYLSVFSFFIPAPCNADSLTVQFDIAGNVQPCGPPACSTFQYTVSLYTIPSVGSLTLALLPNGQIQADLVSSGGYILGFGYEASAGNQEFSPISPDIPNRNIGGSLGFYTAGFSCTFGCGQQENFVIGTPGQYSSVYNIVGSVGNGGYMENPLTSFLLDEFPGSYANQVGADGPSVPEPAFAFLILFIGLAIVIALKGHQQASIKIRNVKETGTVRLRLYQAAQQQNTSSWSNSSKIQRIPRRASITFSLKSRFFFS